MMAVEKVLKETMVADERCCGVVCVEDVGEKGKKSVGWWKY